MFNPAFNNVTRKELFAEINEITERVKGNLTS
jgi:hypothetical protein